MTRVLTYLRRHHLALIALFVALGGTSYAAATGSIDSREIKNNTVRSKDIRNNSIQGRDIRRGTVVSSDVKDRSLLATDFQPGQLPAGPTGPSNAYSAFRTDISNLPNGPGRGVIVSLGDLPAGDYVIFAKLYVTSSPTTSGASVDCRLETGADYDQSLVNVSPGDNASMALNVVRSFGAPGTAALACKDFNTGAEAHYMKVTAIRVGEVRNVASP